MIPDDAIFIVDDRVLDLIAQDGLAYVVGLFFGRELRRMHADDDQFVRVFLFELLQLRNDVHAVDAAISPEVEQYDFAAQLADRDRPLGVQPLQAFGKIGRINFAFIFGHGLLSFLNGRAFRRHHRPAETGGEHQQYKYQRDFFHKRLAARSMTNVGARFDYSNNADRSG